MVKSSPSITTWKLEVLVSDNKNIHWQLKASDYTKSDIRTDNTFIIRLRNTVFILLTKKYY